MLLNHVNIQHYKSLADVNVEFHPGVTVIVGPNATGKSNFVDALRFLRDAAKDGIDHALLARQGIVRVQQLATSKPLNIGFSLKASASRGSVDGVNEKYAYAASIERLRDGNFQVAGESANGEAGAVSFEIQRNKQGNVTFSQSSSVNPFIELQKAPVLQIPKDQLAMSSVSAAGLDTMRRFIQSWNFSNPAPNILKELRPPDRDTSLREDGTNWASMLRAMNRTPLGRVSLERIYALMQAFLPTFIDTQVNQIGSYLVPQFRFSNGARHRNFDPMHLSDGTLRIFGILLSLYQNPAPSILIIEEPEQNVHPGALSMLADAFKEASEATQIIVTTHSPHLVDHFEPEQIRVVSMEGGETRIAGIKQSQKEAIQRHLMSLSEFMLAEGLQPQSP